MTAHPAVIPDRGEDIFLHKCRWHERLKGDVEIDECCFYIWRKIHDLEFLGRKQIFSKNL
jgi:hypothetical protein